MFWPMKILIQTHTIDIYTNIETINKNTNLFYTEFIVVQLCSKLLAYRNTLESVPGTNQYWAMSVSFLLKETIACPCAWTHAASDH